MNNRTVGERKRLGRGRRSEGGEEEEWDINITKHVQIRPSTRSEKVLPTLS
jgi:hypothetical protein